jgi:hypothetical protein
MAQTQGIRTRHSRTCASRTGARCNCDPTYEAWIYSKRDKKKIRRSFPTQAAAKGWRTDALKAVKDKKLRAPSPKTIRQEVDEWLAGAREGRILNKREQPYKPAVLRNYELALRLRVLPTLGDRRLSDIDLSDLLELKEQLLGEGVSGSTIRNSFVPLQGNLPACSPEWAGRNEPDHRPWSAHRGPEGSGCVSGEGAGAASGASRGRGGGLGNGVLHRAPPRRDSGTARAGR